jgi:hypothetical protein
MEDLPELDDSISIEKVTGDMMAPKLLNRKSELRYRIKTAMHMYAPDELVKLAEKHKLIPKSVKKSLKGDEAEKQVVPGIAVADLLVMRLIIDGVEGDKSAIKILFEHGFGRPDLNVNYTGLDDHDDSDDIPMTTEEKIEHLRRFRRKSLEAQVMDEQ